MTPAQSDQYEVDAPALKPCPFCGGVAVGPDSTGEGEYDITCIRCLSGGIAVGPRATDLPTAITLWNTRTPTQPDPTPPTHEWGPVQTPYRPSEQIAKSLTAEQSAADRVRELEQRVAELEAGLQSLANALDGINAEYIAEGMHAGLRKGSDAVDAHAIWSAIANSETSAWIDAAEFAVGGIDFHFGDDLRRARTLLTNGGANG